MVKRADTFENMFFKHQLSLNQPTSLLAKLRQKLRMLLIGEKQILQEPLRNLLDGFGGIETRFRHRPFHIIEGRMLLDFSVEKEFVLERCCGRHDGVDGVANT